MSDSCPTCDGTGATPVGGDDAGQTRSVCWKCDGTGKSPANLTQPFKPGDKPEWNRAKSGELFPLTHSEARIANAAFAAGRAHIWEQIEKRIYPAPPFDTKDWQTEYECLTADLAEMFLPERGFGDPAEGYREMADESLELSESTLPAAPAPPEQEGE